MADIINELLDLKLTEVPLDLNSMLYWWEKVKDIEIPKPRTLIFPFFSINPSISLRDILLYSECVEHGDEYDNACDVVENIEKLINDLVDEIKSNVGTLGYPVFLRTDQGSHKHQAHHDNPRNPAYKISSEDEIKTKIRTMLFYASSSLFYLIVSGRFYAVPKALVIREWIEPDTWILFKEALLRNKPYNRIEVRAIITDGKLRMMFPYYHISGLVMNYSDIDGIDWEYIFRAYKNKYVKTVLNDLDLIREYARQIAKNLEGDWSVDFMKGKDGKWYFIDMALARYSYVPPKTNELSPDARELLKRFESIE